MKKVLCIILTMVLLLGVSLFPVSAEQLDKHVVGITHNGYEICILNPLPILPRGVIELIGDYLFCCGNQSAGITDEGATAIYVVKGEEIFYIKNAYECGLIDLDEVAEMINGYYCYVAGDIVNGYETYLMGDTNGNRKLEVADAVIIQKIIAKQINLDMNIICDVDKNREINMEDVLLLQKKIAKIVA